MSSVVHPRPNAPLLDRAIASTVLWPLLHTKAVIPDKARSAAEPGSNVQPRPASAWTPDLRGCAACQG
jgi:hypothetical protein